MPDLRGLGGPRRQPLPPALGGGLTMSNLAPRYLGLELAHPVIASASPLTATFDGMRRLEDAGAAAVVMASLFEEQIRAEDTRYATLTEYTAGSSPEAATYFPELPDYRYGVSGHIDTLRRAAGRPPIPPTARPNRATPSCSRPHASHTC